MAAVANVRVNVQAPFPALVTGAAGISIAKNNGVWQVGLVSGQLVSIMQAAGFIPSFSGSGLLDFGAFPGATDAQLVITGQTAILSGSTVQAFLLPAATADHSIDEYWLDGPAVMAGNIVPGVGFTIYGNSRFQMTGSDGLLTYGKWNVGWRWQ